MANTIKIKRSVPPSETAPAALARGELAYQENTKLLFIGSGNETLGVAANVISIADEVGTARPCDGTGTQVSTDVTLAGKDYITRSAQTLTLSQIDLTDDVTGVLPAANVVALNAITSPTASVSMNSQKITGLATPTADGDAATMGYVDDKYSRTAYSHSFSNASSVPITHSLGYYPDVTILKEISEGVYDEVEAQVAHASTLALTVTLSGATEGLVLMR
jgi:hypothetical protein